MNERKPLEQRSSTEREELLEEIIAKTQAARPPSRYQRFQAQPDILAAAKQVAEALNRVVIDRKLFTTMGNKKHLWIEAWTTLGGLVGAMPRTVDEKCRWVQDGQGDMLAYEATVEVVDAETGVVIGSAIARCDPDEVLKKGDGTTYFRWLGPDGLPSKHSIMSMAQTRASSKALSSVLRWIVTLAGYEGTAAEEMEVSGHQDAGFDQSAQSAISDQQRRRMWAIAYKRAEAVGMHKDQAGDIISFVCDDLKVNKREIPSHAYEDVILGIEGYTNKGEK